MRDWTRDLARLETASDVPLDDAWRLIQEGRFAEAAPMMDGMMPTDRAYLTRVFEVAAVRGGFAPVAVLPLGERLVADLDARSVHDRGGLRVWAREVGQHLPVDAIAARDRLGWGPRLAVAVVDALCPEHAARAVPYAQTIAARFVEAHAVAWARIGVALDDAAALERAARSGDLEPWIQDGAEEAFAHAEALGCFARGSLPADHRAVQIVVAGLLRLGQSRARKDARSYGLLAAAQWATTRAEPGWRAIADRLRDRIHTEALKDRVAEDPAATSEEAWPEVTDALREMSARAPVPWRPQYPGFSPEEPGSVELVGDRSVVVKWSKLKKHRKKKGALEPVAQALLAVDALDEALDVADELAADPYQCGKVLRHLARHRRSHPAAWTLEHRERFSARLRGAAGRDGSYIARAAREWIDGEERAGVDTRELDALFVGWWDRVGAELTRAVARQDDAALARLAEAPLRTMKGYWVHFFTDVLDRTPDAQLSDAATAALRMGMPGDWSGAHDLGMGQLQTGVRHLWHRGRGDVVARWLGEDLPANVARDLRWMVWHDAEHAPDPLAALEAAWPRPTDGPEAVARFVAAARNHLP